MKKRTMSRSRYHPDPMPPDPTPSSKALRAPTAPPTVPGRIAAVPPCALCSYDLTGTVEAGEWRCPECGWEFTEQDLALLGPSNPRGEPRTLKRNESRMNGKLLLIILTIVSALFVASAIYLTSV